MMDLSERWKFPCPKCQHRHVHFSHPKWFEVPLRWVSMFPYRCYSCGNRFLHRRIRESDGIAPPVRRGGLKAECPNCAHHTYLDLSPPEFADAQQNGWYVSCPGCRATFVAKFSRPESGDAQPRPAESGD